MQIAGAVTGGVTGRAIVHIEREVGHFFHFGRSIKTLDDNIRQLEATQEDVQGMIDVALRNDRLINDSVQDWMTRANRDLLKARNLSEEASVIKGWFRGWFCGRFSLGRKAQKIIQVIQGLYAEGRGFNANNVSHSKPYQTVSTVGTEDFERFGSRESTAEEIREALKDDAKDLVGVYGMPGVGKTTLIKAIAKELKEDGRFKEVVVVTVSQNPNLLKLQDSIAERLDLKDLGVDLSVRADRLRARLNQDAKTLVVLDDVWEKIKLSEVGIPYKNNGKCCKVVFATRSEDVCNEMEANTKIQLSVLSEEDSWFLFQQKSGNIEDSSLARNLLKECKGLPLAIVTLGLALRGKDAIVWADVLVQLRKSIFEGMMSPVVFSIKLSYDYLLSKSVKICFLYCCLFPEDHKIKLDVLLRYMMGEKLLENVETYDEARGRLHSIVVKLVSSGLLLRSEYSCIMMHDVVRDVAISIAAKEEGQIVEVGKNLSDWPDMDLKNCKRLSMMHNSIKRLPTIQIIAPNLRALFLNNNFFSTELPPDIFAEMKSLVTLDLSDTCIEFLPSSLSYLQNLRTLFINNTPLQSPLPIDKLERLEVLSLRWEIDRVSYFRFIYELPEVIRNLIYLRILDLTGLCSSNRDKRKGFSDIRRNIFELAVHRPEFYSSNRIRPDLFLNLFRLEELHLFASFISQISISTQANNFLDIRSLSRLTFLELAVYNPEMFHVDFPGPWQDLTRFTIHIGSRIVDLAGSTHFSRNMKIYIDIGGKEVGNWGLVLLGRTYYLEVERWEDLESLTELGAAVVNGMNENLKSLKLRQCDKMECLVSSNTGLFQSNQNAFLRNLENVEMVSMPAFVEICKGTPPPPGFLYKLKKLTLGGCKGLVTAIPRKLIHNLQNLESLKITFCLSLEHVVQMEEENEESLVSSNSNSNMTRITISDPLVFSIFPNLKDVEIRHVLKIRYVFTMRIARNLLQLEKLHIDGCRGMEVLFKYEDGEDIQFNEDTAILPRLKKLSVIGAPQFKSFTNQNLVMEFPSLQELQVTECGMLERLPFGATSVPNLKKFQMVQELSNNLEWEDESVKQRLQAILNTEEDED